MAQLGLRAKEDMIRLWDAAGRMEDVDFFTYVVDAFPGVVDPYQQLAAQISATLFEDEFPGAAPAVVAALPAVEQLRKSAEWALGADGSAALDRLGGTIQRAVFDGDRQTTVVNAQRNGMRWIRVARPNCCAFCRMLATRMDLDSTYRGAELNTETGEYETRVAGRSVNLSIGDRRAIASGQMTREEALARRDEMQQTYQIGNRKGQARARSPRGVRRLGDKYHDDCYCTARAVPVGLDPLELLFEEDPDYATQVDMWTTEYNKAREASGSSDPKKILAAWRELGADIA